MVSCVLLLFIHHMDIFIFSIGHLVRHSNIFFRTSGQSRSDYRFYIPTVLSKFVGSVRQSDIFYECLTRKQSAGPNAVRKYKNIHLVDEKKRNTSDHIGQKLGFMSSLRFVGTRSS